MKKILKHLLFFLTGAIYGVGLSLSNMINPEKILSFLDITGSWDPTLLLVMIGAITLMFSATRIANRMKAPLLESAFHYAKYIKIDFQLFTGAALFGIGWGLVGLCPGPAIASLIYLNMNSILFFGSMLVGMILCETITRTKENA